MVNNSQNNGGNAISTPAHFICPISGEIFEDPVMASDGQTYERKGITKWIKQKGSNATSPLTGLKLKTKVLTPNHSMKSLVAEWQQKNKNGKHLEKSLKYLAGELITASSSEELIRVINNISNVIQSSDKVLVTMKKLDKWTSIVDDELLTAEVISSFDVLKSQVLVITNKKEIELKQLSDINKCQSLMMEKKQEESMQIDIEHKKVYDKYEKSKAAFEKARAKMNNDELELKRVKKAKDTNAQQIEILAGLMQQSISEMNNNNNIVCDNSSSNNSNGKRDLSIINGSSRKSKRRKTNSNTSNNDVDLSFGARKLFEDGLNHAVFKNSKLFIPLKYQTMIEASAYGGSELAIGYCHLHGLGKFVNDEKKGYNIINKYIKTRKDDSLAQYLMGRMYYYGRGVTQDYKKAVEWFTKAAEQGNAKGQNNLGVLYENGKGVTKDKAKAVEWYTKSAEQGYATGQNHLGAMYRKGYGVTTDDKKAFEWYTKSAEQGYAGGQSNLGVMYRIGQGVTKDYKKAFEWFTKSAEQGYARGQCSLGVMYDNGYGVTKDYKKAVEWFTKTAEKGYARGQCNLGVMYENGKGVTKDYKKAIEWYTKAAEQGDTNSIEALARLS